MSEACKRFGGKRRPAAPVSPQSLAQNVRLCTKFSGNLNGWRYEGSCRAHPTASVVAPARRLLFVRLRFRAAVRYALWNGARKLERSRKTHSGKEYDATWNACR